MEKIALIFILVGLGGCAWAPASVSTPGQTVGIFYPNLVVTQYNPVVYPARPTTTPPEERSGRDVRRQYPEYNFTE